MLVLHRDVSYDVVVVVTAVADLVTVLLPRATTVVLALVTECTLATATLPSVITTVMPTMETLIIQLVSLKISSVLQLLTQEEELRLLFSLLF